MRYKLVFVLFLHNILLVYSSPIVFSIGAGFANGIEPIFANKNKQNGLEYTYKIDIVNTPPIITATVSPVFCVNVASPLLSQFSITDSDDFGVSEIHIKISQGYELGEDLLSFQGTTSNLTSIWRSDIGKLTIRSLTGLISYSDLEMAMLSVMYSNSNPLASGTRIFSIYLGAAEYNYTNNHFYLYQSQQNITWTDAFLASSGESLYGMQSYFVTITSEEEMLFIGNQVTQTGWIGASDQDNEGIWKWISGPEAGEIFWIGGVNGTAVSYANWDNVEPSNANTNENFAQIIPNHPLLHWNDNRNIGDATGAYETPGYTIEFGGLPTDPPLTFVTNVSTELLPKPVIADQASCGSSTFTFTSSLAQTFWFADQSSTVPLFNGQVFTTPLLLETTTYYVSQYLNSCIETRVAVTATINEIPTLLITEPDAICLGQDLLIVPQTNGTSVKWFTDVTTSTSFATGDLIVNAPTENGVLYSEAQLGTCKSERISVAYTVLYVPPSVSTEIAICPNSIVQLTASSGFAYQWNTGLTSSSILVNDEGMYTVLISVENGCTYTEEFNVAYPILPLTPSFTFENGGVTIQMENVVSFEYSLDGINYQNSPFFYLENGGKYLLYVRDRNYCTVTTFPFLWIKSLPFFTPNGDGINDVWTLEGALFIDDFKLYIFDRYGHQVGLLTNDNPIWDGTFNGVDLPSTDYWYRVEANNFPIIGTGHFSLKR